MQPKFSKLADLRFLLVASQYRFEENLLQVQPNSTTEHLLLLKEISYIKMSHAKGFPCFKE